MLLQLLAVLIAASLVKFNKCRSSKIRTIRENAKTQYTRWLLGSKYPCSALKVSNVFK